MVEQGLYSTQGQELSTAGWFSQRTLAIIPFPGFRLKCLRDGAVKLRATFDLVADKTDVGKVVLHTSNIYAHLECAEAKTVRVFAAEKPQAPLREKAMAAECGKTHELVAVVYSDKGDALSALKYESTLAWSAKAGSDTLLKTEESSADGDENAATGSNKTTVALKVPSSVCANKTSYQKIDVSASYRVQLTDAVVLLGSEPLRARWDGYPSTALVVPTNDADGSVVLTVSGGNSKAPLQFDLVSGAVKVDTPHTSSCGEEVQKGTQTATSSSCRSEWILTPTDGPTDAEVMISDLFSLGSVPLKLDFNFGTVADVVFDKYTLQREHGVDVVVDLTVSNENKHPIHPALWKRAGLVCELQNAEGVADNSSMEDSKMSFLGTEQSSAVKISSLKLPVGTHTISCFLEGSSLRAMSSVTVFHKLSLLPAELVALPRQTGEFTILGGSGGPASGGIMGDFPAGVRRRFSSSNEKVVSVVDSAVGSLLFKSEGEAEVTVELYTGEEVLAVASGRAVVGWPAKGAIAGTTLENSEEEALKIVGSRTVDATLFTESGAQFTPALLSFPAAVAEIMDHGLAEGANGGANSTGENAGPGQDSSASWWANVTSGSASSWWGPGAASAEKKDEFRMDSENPFSCVFKWTLEGSSLLLFPANQKREISGRGLSQVEIKSLDEVATSSTETVGDLTLEVNCRSSSVTMRKRIEVGLPLLSAGAGSIVVPTGSNVPLAPYIRADGDQISATLAHVRGKSLSLDHELFVLHAEGVEEADAVLLLRDLAQKSAFENAVVAVSARAPDELRLATVSSRAASSSTTVEEGSITTLILPEGSSAVVNVALFSKGNKLAFSRLEKKLSAFASHPSRVHVAVLGGSNQVRLTARLLADHHPTGMPSGDALQRSQQTPCSTVQIDVGEVNTHTRIGHGFHQTRTVRVCVAKDRLLPAPGTSSEKLLLHTGARVSFFVDPRSTGAAPSPALRKFALKLKTGATADVILTSFETELRMFLRAALNVLHTDIFAVSKEDAVAKDAEFVFAVSKDAKLSTQRLVEQLWTAAANKLFAAQNPILAEYWDRESFAAIRPVTEVRGSWVSANTKLLKFGESGTGIATAGASTTGETVITYTSEFQQTAVITVDTVHSLQFAASVRNSKLLSWRAESGETRVDRNRETLIPLSFLNSDGNVFDTRSPFIQQNIDFKCGGDQLLETFFGVEARGAGGGVGVVACSLFPKKIASEKLLALGKVGGELQLAVTVGGKRFERKLPFSPAFVLLDRTGAELDMTKPMRLSRDCGFLVAGMGRGVRGLQSPKTRFLGVVRIGDEVIPTV